MLTYLLEMGADPNKQANCGATALHYAAEAGHLPIADKLLSAGARWMKNKYGFSPAMHAAIKCQVASVAFLLSRTEADIKVHITTFTPDANS